MNKFKESVTTELETLIQKVNTSAEKRKQIENAQTELVILREKQLQQTKILRKIDTPAITLDYLLILRKMISRELTFDFLSQTPKDSALGYNIYTISGEANMSHLKKIIYHLEQQKPIYTIPSFSFSGIQAGVTDSIRFAITLHSYFDISGSPNELIAIEPKYFPYSDFQLFKMGVYNPIKEQDPDLPDSEALTILAMTKEFVVFRNPTGKLLQLKPGDAVQFGKMHDIQFEKKQAIFVINKIGIWKTIIVTFEGGIE
jgi:hypothetical protein